MRRFATSFITVLVLPAAALAQPLYPVQQERYVTASTTSPDPNNPNQVLLIEDYAAAPGFDLWQADAHAEATDGPRWGNGGQYSTFSPTAMDAFGAADIGLTAGSDYATTYVSDAGSVYQLRFAVPENVTFDLVGYASVEITVDSFAFEWWMDVLASVELRQIAGPTVYFDEAFLHMTSNDWEPHHIVELPVAAAGELPPGVYELYVVAGTHGETQWNSWSGPPITGEASHIVSAEFAPLPPEVPGEGDLDGDGDVDLADFARFQRAFSGPLPDPQP